MIMYRYTLTLTYDNILKFDDFIEDVTLTADEYGALYSCINRKYSFREFPTIGRDHFNRFVVQVASEVEIPDFAKTSLRIGMLKHLQDHFKAKYNFKHEKLSKIYLRRDVNV